MNICLLTALLPFCAAEGTMPPPPRAPLLFVRFVGPDGSRITVRPGTPEARMLDTPTVVGFRPGYGYRLQLGNLPILECSLNRNQRFSHSCQRNLICLHKIDKCRNIGRCILRIIDQKLDLLLLNLLLHCGLICWEIPCPSETAFR